MRQKGFSPIVIFLIFVIIGAIGLVLFKDVKIQNSEKIVAPNTTNQPDPTIRAIKIYRSSPEAKTNPTLNWKSYSNKQYSFKYPDEHYVILSESDQGVNIGTKVDEDFVYLRVSNKITINTQDYQHCSQNDTNEEKAVSPCVGDKSIINIDQKEATLFNFVAGGPDSAYRIVQFSNPILEFKMYVAGGGLSDTFNNILSTLEFN